MTEGPRRQFTWANLLMLGLCLFVLAVILLPMIDGNHRGPSRRSTCQNNLRQFALAATAFEAQSQKLPANRQLRKTSTGELTVGWVYDLLPFMEEQNAYDLLKKNAADPGANGKRLPLLVCPSDATITRPTDISYQVNGGCPNRPSDNYDAVPNGVSDDLAGGKLPTVRASSKNVKDGTTCTLYYIENLNAQRWNEDYYHFSSQSHEDFHAVLWLPVRQEELEKAFHRTGKIVPEKQIWAINEGKFDRSGPEFARPSSSHPGGFQAAFVGGNIRFISETIDYRVYARLMSSNGSRTIDPSDTSESRSRAIRAWQSVPLEHQEYE